MNTIHSFDGPSFFIYTWWRMTLLKAVAHNTLTQVIGKAVSTVLGVAVVFLVTRALGPSGYGEYTTVITFLSFFGIVADLGLTLITAQMISERGADERRIVGTIFSFRALTALVAYGVAPIAALFTDYSAAEKIGIVITAWSFFFVSMQQTLQGVFQKNLVMKFPMIAEVCGRVALLAVTAYGAWRGEPLWWFLSAVVIGNVVNFAFVWFYARRIVPFSFAWDGAVVRETMQRSWPIAISIVFNLVYLKADTLILRSVGTLEDVGYYGAAYRVVDILMMVPVMMMGVILPIVTRAWTDGDAAAVRRVVQKTFNAFVVYAVPLLLGGIVIAQPLMELIAGREFAAAGAPLRVLLLAFASATVSTLFGHLIVALQKQRNVIWVYGVDAVLALVAYAVFIPRYGMMGAAWATFGSELFAAAVLGVIAVRVVRLKISWSVCVRACGAAALMALAVATVPQWHVGAVIFVAAVVYGGALLIGRVHREFI